MEGFWSNPQLALDAFPSTADLPVDALELAQSLDADTDSLLSLLSHLTDSDSGDTHVDISTRASERHDGVPTPTPKQPPAHSGNAAAPPKPPPKRLRKHNRIEILDLRDELEALHAQLAKLKRAKEDTDHTSSRNSGERDAAADPPPRLPAGTASSAVLAHLALRNAPPKTRSTAPASPHCVWLDVAVEQYAHLQRSEALSRKLRAAVKKQAKLSALVQTLLRKKSSDVASLLPVVTLRVLSPPRQLPTSDLYASVELLFARAPVVSRAIQLSHSASTAFHSCRSTHDAVSGPSVEITTSTPAACDFQHLGQLVWANTAHMCDSTASTPSPRLTNAHERPMDATFASPFGDVRVKGAGVIQLFEDANHLVIASTIKSSVGGTDLVLREHSWVIFTNAFSASDVDFVDWTATPGAHFQTCYRLYSEQFDATSATGSVPFAHAPDERTKQIQALVTTGLGDRMCEYVLLLQSLLVAEMEHSATRKLPFRWPALKCPYS